MDEHHIAALDARRTIGHQPFRSLCYAPDLSLYFDVRGNAIACCQNTTDVLGNVNQASLREIWDGQAARAMRSRLRSYAFADGCSFCAWELDHGAPTLFAANFDRDAVPDDSPRWPLQMEFALSNRCNLACVMCNGDFSSTIRTQRERRPPLPAAYGDEFFAQLREFLPHLRRARFFGGEPFLIPEYQRIWDLMVEVGAQPECNVTTNGTVLTPRIEATLHALPFSIAVSVDGMTAATVESIRVGADHRAVLANIDRLHTYCAQRGTSFWLTYCLMRQNWHEFADFLVWADGLDAAVAVNTVVYPGANSLYRLPADELLAVVTALDRHEGPTGRNASVWEHERQRLRSWLTTLEERGRANDQPVFFEHWDPAPTPTPSTVDPPAPAASPVPVAGPVTRTAFEAAVGVARRRLDAAGALPVSTLDVGPDNRVTAIDGPEATFLGIPAGDLVGRTFPEVVTRLEATFGPLTDHTETTVQSGLVERRVTYTDRRGRVTRILGFTAVDTDGRTRTLAVEQDR